MFSQPPIALIDKIFVPGPINDLETLIAQNKYTGSERNRVKLITKMDENNPMVKIN